MYHDRKVICPACLKAQRTLYEKCTQRIHDCCDETNLDVKKLIELLKQKNSRILDVPTDLYVEYKIGIGPSGNFSVYYFCCCDKCGFTYTFSLDNIIPLT